MKDYRTLRQYIIICAAGMVGVINQAMASGFQIWEQDGASVANYHAGYAAEADNASTAFYNPAGITRIKNQQLIFGADGVATDIQYKGTVGVNTLSNIPSTVTAQGGLFTAVPFLQYVAPITDTLGFGFSVVVPFGAQINYRETTDLKYASTYNSVKVIDITPTLGWQITNKLSIGAGPDWQKMSVEFDQIGTNQGYNATSTNRADDTGWGYHLGGLYQFNPESRIGLSYHSQVVHHLSRSSRFSGELTDLIFENSISSRATANITLPPYTAFSIYHEINSRFTLMTSVLYTQWSSVKHLVMKNLSGLDLITPPDSDSEIVESTNIEVDVPQNFRNTWNVTFGGNYRATDSIILKGGLGFDQTPTQNKYRNVQMPDNNRFVVAFGGHYQANRAIGIDLGWNHVFMSNAKISPPVQITGAQHTTTQGVVTGGADVYAMQVTWDIV